MKLWVNLNKKRKNFNNLDNSKQHQAIEKVFNMNLNLEDHQYQMKYYFTKHNWNKYKKKKIYVNEDQLKCKLSLINMY